MDSGGGCGCDVDVRCVRRDAIAMEGGKVVGLGRKKVTFLRVHDMYVHASLLVYMHTVVYQPGRYPNMSYLTLGTDLSKRAA